MRKTILEASKKYALDHFVEVNTEKGKFSNEDDRFEGFIAGVDYQASHQWVSPLKDLPENSDGKCEGYSIEVLGLFKDGSFHKCNCSIEENVWFIDDLTCDMPVLWTYLPKL